MTLAQILLNPFFGEAYRDRILGMQSAYLIGYWPLNEASGTVCKDYSKATANFEKLSNITFESLGGDTFTSWTDRVSDGAIADAQGRLYVTDPEHSAIHVIDPDGALRTLVRDPRLRL